MAARLGVGNGHLGAGNDRRGVLPRGAPDGPARGGGQDRPQAGRQEAREAARLGAALDLRRDGARYLRARLRPLLARPRRLGSPAWRYLPVTVLLPPTGKVNLSGQGRIGTRQERGGHMRRTATIFMAVTAMAVFLSAGASLAASPIIGTDSGEQIKGTRHSEVIRGLGGDDEISDGLGKDAVYGNEGADNLIGYGGDTSVDRFYGGTGDDTIQSRDVPASKDRVRCGPGVDRVYADKADVVSEDCERVRAW